MSNSDLDLTKRYVRNFGFISEAEQHRLSQITVAIAGVGGVGGKVATELTRLGVTTLRLADPDIFSASNLNRQEGCTVDTLGLKKVAVIADLCRAINPDVTVNVYDEGISAENIDEFISGAEVVIEAIDFMLPHLGVMLARVARSKGVPVLMGVEIGFGATLTWFEPTGSTYEHYFGLKNDVPLADLADEKVTVDFMRWLPHVPRYADLKVLKAVADGKTDVPAIAPAVSICSALITSQVIAHVKGKGGTPSAPAVYHYDAREHRGQIIRFPRWHNRISLLRMVAWNLTGRADKVL